MKTLVVGAGFSGATIAQQLHEAGQDVLVVDRRSHIGGTAYDFVNEVGVLQSSHGAHLFHTQAEHVFDYLGRFTDWMPHEHRVLADVHGMRVPMPINRTTVNMLLGLQLQTDEEVAAQFALMQESMLVSNSESQVCSRVGRRLFDLLYRDYTLKQWGRPASELSSYVAGRLPIRTNDDDRFFVDEFQAQPADGWTAMFERMLDGVDVELAQNSTSVNMGNFDRVVYTGPIDEFFDYCFGPLPFRSVSFQHEHFAGGLRLPAGVVNYPGPEPYTRRIEWRHFTHQDCAHTTISTEFPAANGEPHYPVPCEASWALHGRYTDLAKSAAPNVVFTGRLGSYKYMTMDQTVAQALKISRRLMGTSGRISV